MFSYRIAEKKIYASSSNITDNTSCIDKLFSFGIAGVVTKTISSFSDGVGIGKIWWNKNVLYNSTIFSSKGLNTWIEVLSNYNKKNKIVIPSVYSSDRKELADMMKVLQQIQMPAIEMGISCPNESMKKKLEIIKDISYAIQGIYIPVYIKLCSQGMDIKMMKEYCEMGITGFVISDSFPGFMDEAKKQRIGISGEKIRPYVLESIELAREKGITAEIVGTGGIFTGEHIEQYRKAGADAVGLCSCMYINGINSVKSLLNYERNEKWQDDKKIM